MLVTICSGHPACGRPGRFHLQDLLVSEVKRKSLSPAPKPPGPCRPCAIPPLLALIPPPCIYRRQSCRSRAPGPPDVLYLHFCVFAGVFCISQKPSARTHSRVSAHISSIMKYRPDLCSSMNSINFQTNNCFYYQGSIYLSRNSFKAPGRNWLMHENITVYEKITLVFWRCW